MFEKKMGRNVEASNNCVFVDAISMLIAPTRVENKCIPGKDLARSLQKTDYVQDLARSYKVMFSLKDS